MLRLLSLLVLAGAAVTAPARPLHAQRLLHVGAAGGLSVPQNALGNIYETGLSARGFVEISIPNTRVGVRATVEYETYDAKRLPTGETSGFTLVGYGGDVTYDLETGPMAPVEFYVLGGAGLYELTRDDGESAPVTGVVQGFGTRRLGWQLGLGLRFGLGPLQGFVEGRYRSIRAGDAVKMMPVAVGLRL